MTTYATGGPILKGEHGPELDVPPTGRPVLLLHLFVPGVPRPQGSKRPFRNQHSGKIAMVESSQHVKTWRDDIRGAIIYRLPAAAPFTCPVDVTLLFVMPRPKGHHRTGRNAHILRDTAPTHPIGKPDIDKLARAVLDAIGSAGLWVDDSQVVDLNAIKRYEGAQLGRPGVVISVSPRPERHPQFMAFKERALQDPEVREAYDAARLRGGDSDGK